jgi:HK97 family phage prohead protease
MKFFYPKVKGINAESRRITVCISKNEIDRHNERIEISAIADALQLYATNPVVLGDHQHRLSTGKSSVIGHTIPETFNVLENEVDMDIEFSITENAETYWINFRDGHQLAVSIGFIDLEWRTEDVDGKKIFVSTKIELLEVSCVAVGANRGALVKAKGMFDRVAEPETLELLTKDPGSEQLSVLQKLISDLKSFVESEVDEIKSLLITDSDRFAEDLLGGPSDPSAPGGDNNNAEQSLKRIVNALQFGGKNNANE